VVETMRNDVQPFAFIVGRGRSGTTLLRAMLTSHPEMAIPHETHFIVPLSRDRRAISSDGEVRPGPLMEQLFKKPGFKNMELEESEVRTEFAARPPTTYQEAIRGLFALYARKHGKARYGDKTPINVIHIEYLARLFPEAKFIHMIRDGRNVALSQLELEFGQMEDLWDAAVYWRRFVKRGRKAGAELGPARYCELRYEDLLDEPEQTLRSMSEFLELEFDESMLRYFEKAPQIVGSVRHFQNVYRPPTKGLRDWRQQMSTEQIALFEALAGDLLEELGYERSTKTSAAQTTLARARWIQVQWRRMTRGVRKRGRVMRRRAKKRLEAA
jgi:hypothetical protein